MLSEYTLQCQTYKDKQSYINKNIDTNITGLYQEGPKI